MSPFNAVLDVQQRTRAHSVSMSEAPSSSSGSDTLVDDDYSELDLNIETESVYTLCSQQESASDLTVSDVPGAGRTLGLLYARWGRALEASVSRFAHKRGHGPDAVAEQIARTTFRGTRVAGTDTKRAFSFVEWKVADGNEAKLHTCCQKLVCYTGSNEQLTRMRALEQTIQLVTAQPRFRPYFREPVIVGRLRDIVRSTSISSTNIADWRTELELHQDNVFLAKQALICIEENSLNQIVDEVLQLPFSNGNRFARQIQYPMTMSRLLDCCRNGQFTFVAKRYLCSALNYLPWREIASREIGTFWSQLITFLEQIVTSSLETVAVDLESTERLLITVLLPRCRAMHTLDFNRVLYNPQSSCRCKRYGQAIQEMQPLLDLLRRPEARNIFQRATAIVDQLWESKDDDTLG